MWWRIVGYYCTLSEILSNGNNVYRDAVETDDNPSYLNGIAFHAIRRIIIRLYSTLPTNIPIAD